jgi:hypothetical protein
MMSVIVTQPTSTALWHQLVTEAERHTQRHLAPETESYLVFMLMRFLGRPEIASSVVAMDYLEGLLLQGHSRDDKLRDVGDTCLLYSGMFPMRAKRRRVKVSYFVDLGRSAYLQLSDTLAISTAELFQQLSDDFIPMMDILHTIRELGNSTAIPDPLQAMELWNDTGSQAAYRSLLELSDNKSHPAPPPGDNKH